jgi:hypothetical protein
MTRPYSKFTNMKKITFILLCAIFSSCGIFKGDPFIGEWVHFKDSNEGKDYQVQKMTITKGDEFYIVDSYTNGTTLSQKMLNPSISNENKARIKAYSEYLISEDGKALLCTADQKGYKITLHKDSGILEVWWGWFKRK